MSKIDTKQSPIYKYNSRCDLSQCVLMLGKKGYFSDSEDFRQYTLGTLYEVKCKEGGYIYPYVRECKGDEGEFEIVCYKYFIPESKVVFKKKPKEKKYRPFKTVEEFVNHMGLRDSSEVQFISLKSKTCSSRYYLTYNGYEVDRLGCVYIHLGSLAFTFYELFTNYEYELNSFEWLPFGVEE